MIAGEIKESPLAGLDRVFSVNRLVIELIPDPELGGFTARLPDVPAYGEGTTEDEAISDLKVALRTYIDAYGYDDAMALVVIPTVRELDWDLAEIARG